MEGLFKWWYVIFWFQSVSFHGLVAERKQKEKTCIITEYLKLCELTLIMLSAVCKPMQCDLVYNSVSTFLLDLVLINKICN